MSGWLRHWATVNSVHDPLGLATPVTLGGRLMLRKLTDIRSKQSKEHRQQLMWYDVLPTNLLNEWKRGKDSLSELQDIYIPRWYHPKNFGQINHIELHAFSDASKEAIGVVIYLKSTDQYDRVFVSLLVAQSRLSPKRLTPIPD